MVINTRLVTCQASHLTALGVEEFAVEQQSAATDDPSVLAGGNRTASDEATEEELLMEVNLWASWAVYLTFSLVGLLGLGMLWGYQKDKRDLLNLRKILLTKEKIYVNLFLDPLPEDEMARNL